MKTLKNIITLSLLFCISIVTFSACEKIASDTPSTIKKLIRENKKGCLGEVIEYKYNESYIYLFKESVCDDGFTIAYDEKGNELWREGGVMGMRGQEDFYNKAVLIRVIWTDKYLKQSLIFKNHENT